MKKYQRNQTYVVSGETFNEIADAVNWTHENQARLNGPDAFNKSFQNGEIRIKYLDSGTLPTFSAVALTGLAITPRDSKFIYNTPTLNANKVTTSNEKNAFAICAEPANSGKLTKAVLTGIIPAKVTIKDATHEFAKPTPGGSGTLESCEAGTARIIWKAGNSGEQWCILQLGAGGAEVYDGPFALSIDENGKLKCKGGYLNRNGEIVSVSDASGITPSTGYVCVYSNISGNTWTTPEIKIESTVKIGDYPVGYCQMNNNVPALTQYRVAMAIIMITGNCPVNATT